MLTQVQEGVLQVPFDLFLDALQHVIRAVALVPFEHFLEVAHTALSHDADPLGDVGSFPLHPGIIELLWEMQPTRS